MKIQVTFDTAEESEVFFKTMEALRAKDQESESEGAGNQKIENAPVTETKSKAEAEQPAQPDPQQAAPQPVPTAAHSYTAEDLQKAAITLVDKGMMAQLQGLLQQFGVASLPDLPQDRYGDFATALRGMGAQI